MGVERRDRVGGEHGRFVALADVAHEVPGQNDDVVLALPKGWNVDGDDLQAVIQILAEAPLAHERDEVAMGRGEHAHVH